MHCLLSVVNDTALLVTSRNMHTITDRKVETIHSNTGTHITRDKIHDMEIAIKQATESGYLLLSFTYPPEAVAPLDAFPWPSPAHS